MLVGSDCNNNRLCDEAGLKRGETVGFGWGLFNLVEGIIDHQILGVHYVRQLPNYTVYNLAFLAVGGGGLLLVGWLLMKTSRRDVIEL